MKLLFKNFTTLSDDEIVLVHQMRNSDAVRSKMYSQDIITLENHKKWVASLTERNDCLYFLVYADNKAVGVVDFTSIENNACEWGYYLSPDMQNSGYGVLLEYYVLKYAFEIIGVETLFCAVLDSNKNVYETHVKCYGFLPNKNYSSSQENGEGVSCFNGLSLTKENWQKWNNPIIERSLKFFKVEKVIF